MSNIRNNRLNRILTAQEMGQLKQALDTIETILGFRIGLTPDERLSLTRISDGNLPFVEDVRNLFAAGHNYFPRFYNPDHFGMDLELFMQLSSLLPRLQALASSVADTQALAGHEAMNGALLFYSGAKDADRSGEPGAKLAVDTLSIRFEAQRNNQRPSAETPPAPETPPAADGNPVPPQA